MEESGRIVNVTSLLAAIAGAITSSGLALWFLGLWWGMFAYVAAGSVILLAFAVIRAMGPGSHGGPVPFPGKEIGSLSRPKGGSDPGPAHDHRGRPAKGPQIGGKGQGGVVLGVVLGTSGEGCAVALRHLPQAGHARTQKEVVASGID